MDKLVVGIMAAGALICLLGVAGMRMTSIVLPLTGFLAGFLVIGVGFILIWFDENE